LSSSPPPQLAAIAAAPKTAINPAKRFIITSHSNDLVSLHDLAGGNPIPWL
jgi:hypothetical protein